MISAKILIFGLPGSGKTHLAERLQKHLNCAWFNADEIRRQANDWEFSNEARSRQAYRMKNIANFEDSCGRTVICDFVCPTEETRKIFGADISIFMDTISAGRFADTNKLFEEPDYLGEKAPTFRIVKFLSDEGIQELAEDIKKKIS